MRHDDVDERKFMDKCRFTLETGTQALNVLNGLRETDVQFWALQVTLQMVFQILKMGLIDRSIDRNVEAPCGAFPKDTMHSNSRTEEARHARSRVRLDRRKLHFN